MTRLDHFDFDDDEEKPTDGDPKRIPTYERRRVAGTDFKLGKYGYICVLPADDENDALIRKIMPFQRKCILLYYVERHDGKPFNIRKMAKDLAVEDRTIQYDLRWLEKKGYLWIESRTDPKKGSVENAYHFKHAIEDEFYDFKPTVRKAYGIPNSLGLREWHWDDYKTIPGMEDEYHNAYDKYEAVTELNEKRTEQRKIVHKRRMETFPPMVRRNMKKKILKYVKKNLENFRWKHAENIGVFLFHQNFFRAYPGANRYLSYGGRYMDISTITVTEYVPSVIGRRYKHWTSITSPSMDWMRTPGSAWRGTCQNPDTRGARPPMCPVSSGMGWTSMKALETFPVKRNCILWKSLCLQSMKLCPKSLRGVVKGRARVS